MKYILIRCEDTAATEPSPAPLLEGARAAYLQQLAQAGAAGTLRRKDDQPVADRFSIHRGLFGIRADETEATAAQCYAASVNVRLREGETAWCCDFVTHQDGTVVDPTANRITTKESALLIQALNAMLGSETRRWEVGQGSHHLLITHEDALQQDRGLMVHAPDLLVGRRWDRQLPKHPVAESLRMLIGQAMALLEEHSVNRVRIDLGENPANLIWLWGATHGAAPRSFSERTGLPGAVISHGFPMRGFAKALGLAWKSWPETFDEPALQRLTADALDMLRAHDFIYVHLRVDSVDPVERLVAVERLEQQVIKPLAEHFATREPWRLAVVLDDRTLTALPVIAIGDGLPRQPVAQLRGDALRESPLVFHEPVDVFSWLTAKS